MYHDLMLVFADEAEAISHLYDSSTDGEGQVTLTPKYTAIDMIGTIGDAPEWHVNVRNVAEMPELDAFIVTPSPVTPLRVWA